MEGKHCYAKDWEEVWKRQKVVIYHGPVRPSVDGELKTAFRVRLLPSDERKLLGKAKGE